MRQHFAYLVEIRGYDGLPHGHVLKQLSRRSEEAASVRILYVRGKQNVRGSKMQRRVALRHQPSECNVPRRKRMIQSSPYLHHLCPIPHQQKANARTIKEIGLSFKQRTDGTRENVHPMPLSERTDKCRYERIRRDPV